MKTDNGSELRISYTSKEYENSLCHRVTYIFSCGTDTEQPTIAENRHVYMFT